jgi:two-component system CheB/CheR fusion protein
MKRFFVALPHIPRAAFVVVQHQQPHRPSLLPKLLGKYASYAVSEIGPRTLLEAEHVYVAPPSAAVELAGNAFVLDPLASLEERRTRIDRFFQSAAAAFGPRAVGIVLSGAGRDGSNGIRAIAAAGGLTIAQDPSTAVHTGMPKAAIETRTVSHVLAPEEMPATIVAHLNAGQNTEATSLPFGPGHEDDGSGAAGPVEGA